MNLYLRFWSKVLIGDDCWNWIGGKSAGYGRFGIGQRVEIASRVAWYLWMGEWPHRFILHKCDNPSCVRPSHLFEGTQKDNMMDCSQKGRAKGYGSYKTICKQGHEFTIENTYIHGKKRHCRTCRLEWKRNARRLKNK